MLFRYQAGAHFTNGDFDPDPMQADKGALLGDELDPMPSPGHLVLSILFHMQARGHAVVCQSKRYVGSVSHECTWWRFNPFLIRRLLRFLGTRLGPI